MNLLLHYDFLILDKQKTLQIINTIKENKIKNPDIKLVGIYLENLKFIHQEVFPYFTFFSKYSKLKIIFFDIPFNLRIHFYLENIPVKFGCGFLELF